MSCLFNILKVGLMLGEGGPVRNLSEHPLNTDFTGNIHVFTKYIQAFTKCLLYTMSQGLNTEQRQTFFLWRYDSHNTFKLWISQINSWCHFILKSNTSTHQLCDLHPVYSCLSFLMSITEFAVKSKWEQIVEPGSPLDDVLCLSHSITQWTLKLSL